ncbi:actin, partial [Acrasis kona]
MESVLEFSKLNGWKSYYYTLSNKGELQKYSHNKAKQTILVNNQTEYGQNKDNKLSFWITSQDKTYKFRSQEEPIVDSWCQAFKKAGAKQVQDNSKLFIGFTHLRRRSLVDQTSTTFSPVAHQPSTPTTTSDTKIKSLSKLLSLRKNPTRSAGNTPISNQTSNPLTSSQILEPLNIIVPTIQEQQDQDVKVQITNHTNKTLKLETNSAPTFDSPLSPRYNQNSSIVADFGSGGIKAGLSGRDKPHTIIDTLVGRPREKQSMLTPTSTSSTSTAQQLSTDKIYMGKQVQAMRGILSLSRPIQRGLVSDWDDMEHLYHHVLDQYANDERYLLMTEPPHNIRKHREKQCMIMFETFRSPGYYVTGGSALSLYATGRVSGLVVDVGEGVSSCVPIYQGCAISHASNKINVAGGDLNHYLSDLLAQEHPAWKGHAGSTSLIEVVRDIKENVCRVKNKNDFDLGQLKQEYTLPDGTVLSMNENCIYQCAEALFDTSLIGVESPGLPKLCYQSVFSCDVDLRRVLVENVIMAGGSTLMKGFDIRLGSEIDAMTPAGVKCHITSPHDRQYVQWTGGSILASLSEFHRMAISKQEYEEIGPQCV